MIKKKLKTTKKRRVTSALKTDSRWRIKALFLVFFLLGSGLIARLYFLQVIKGEYYAALAVGQKISIDDEKPRGNIYFQDKGGTGQYLAATTHRMPLIYADPSGIKSGEEEEVIRQLNSVLSLTEEELSGLLERLRNKESTYVAIRHRASEADIQRIEDLKISGIHNKLELVRLYPGGKVAPHILGFLGFEGDKRLGQYGVEEFYNSVLSGEKSAGFSIGDPFAQGLAPADLELTIDYGAQFMIEKKMAETYERLKAKAASAIFMDPKTGEIIAMVDFPTFDSNTYSEVKDVTVLQNHAVQSVHELGSIFKPITMASAIDGGAVLPQTTYNDTGEVRIGSYVIRNSDLDSHGIQTMAQVIEKSLNTGAIFAQQELGKKKFKEYLEAFQLNKPTGIDLPGEVSGNIQNIQNTTRDINYATASFGQGVSFSALRFLASISAIANNGSIMKPYIVKKIRQGGREVVTKPEELAKPISSITSSRVTAMMASAVENGYSKKAGVKGYSVAGKTGTAQVPNKDVPGYSDETIHTFVGFAPAYNPRFIGIIKVDSPVGYRFSSESIAPTFGEIADFLLQYYQIPPQ